MTFIKTIKNIIGLILSIPIVIAAGIILIPFILVFIVSVEIEKRKDKKRAKETPMRQ